ncbi:UNVERIFIED_CONTAM: Zinc finger CCCH domain-containing protein 3 [Sesamum angustifolium]|uniref:Zinc finger CCCH domain-containing protein 3 n=1 Tax=Sesamum angustifolium TaxID=2727405 RepID=A0AAW2QAJ5_9LAMI
MPLGKYYCDYCDKQFQDTPRRGGATSKASSTREPKLSVGLDQVQDPRSVGKGVCNRFVLTKLVKFLSFGMQHYPLRAPAGMDSCKYYHPKKNLENMKTQGTEGTSSVTNVQSHGTALLLQLYFVEIKWEHRCKIYPPRCGLLQRVDIHPYPLSIGDKCAF